MNEAGDVGERLLQSGRTLGQKGSAWLLSYAMVSSRPAAPTTQREATDDEVGKAVAGEECTATAIGWGPAGCPLNCRHRDGRSRAAFARRWAMPLCQGSGDGLTTGIIFGPAKRRRNCQRRVGS